MENRYVLFHVALVLNILILVVSFTGVISLPLSQRISPNITEIMKNDTNLCNTSKSLYESEYAKLCASLPYPIGSLNFNEQSLDIFLCLGVYDTAYKICHSLNQSHQIPPFNTTLLTPYFETFVPNATVIQKKEEKFCNNLQGFTSSYDKIDSLLKPLVEELNKSYKCQKICYDLNDKLKPLCAIFAWIKKFDDIIKTNRTETTHLVIPDLVTSNETASNNRNKVKVANELKETIEQNTSKIFQKNNNKGTNLNVPQNISSVHAELDTEKAKYDSEKLSTTHKKSDINLKTLIKSSSPMLDEDKKIVLDRFETNDKIVKPTKTISTNNDLQVPSMNNPASNVLKKGVNEEKGEEQKEQNIDDLKTSTLSENTQDHYDAKNPEEDVETNLDSNIEGINVHKFIFI